jgi:hypothetical protein
MTKQEKIQASYGEYWDIVKDHVNENGWVNCKLRQFDFLINNEVYDRKANGFLHELSRPKSLQGIEHNNSWIKIESEADLPIKQKMCFCYNKLGHVFTTTLSKTNTNYSYIKREDITHYQPITKPEPPIY